jgi:fido (protein-threonine AMPylation protein)
MNPWGVLPGETPLADRSGLKDKSITNRDQLNAAELANIQKATLKYLAARPSKRTVKFNDYFWFLKLHGEMFGDVWDWAGVIRTVPLNLGVAPHLIGDRLATLVDDLKFWNENRPDRIEQAACLHYKAVHIHPFLNGNGRWSRMLANVWLRFNNHPITQWPENVGKESPIRDEYLDAIRKADQSDMNSIIALHRNYTAKKVGRPRR